VGGRRTEDDEAHDGEERRGEREGRIWWRKLSGVWNKQRFLQMASYLYIEV